MTGFHLMGPKHTVHRIRNSSPKSNAYSNQCRHQCPHCEIPASPQTDTYLNASVIGAVGAGLIFSLIIRKKNNCKNGDNLFKNRSICQLINDRLRKSYKESSNVPDTTKNQRPPVFLSTLRAVRFLHADRSPAATRFRKKLFH